MGPVGAGLALLPMSLAGFFVAAASGKLLHGASPRITIGGGPGRHRGGRRPDLPGPGGRRDGGRAAGPAPLPGQASGAADRAAGRAAA
ncbi:hypothetical protein [Streptomyces sp. H34-S4]|uniref:hypothetical protein n=1 Tax=Streptomyces sp. H34-S4 TaxID=2996463 RepID=UPI00226D4406|nr:hypothetical protein [Streptomyces sp. H34-S4]MCY0933492.1 hypothetical protein [Streptomyces sp. H34-S4]